MSDSFILVQQLFSMSQTKQLQHTATTELLITHPTGHAYPKRRDFQMYSIYWSLREADSGKPGKIAITQDKIGPNSG